MLPSLQRSGSRRILATSADGYFRYIAESVVSADFTEAKQKDRMQKKVLHSACNKNILHGNTARKYFWFVPERICRFQSGRCSFLARHDLFFSLSLF